MSDIHQMTTPLGEIALNDALSYIDRLRAEVYRARAERDEYKRKLDIKPAMIQYCSWCGGSAHEGHVVPHEANCLLKHTGRKV